MSYSLFMALQAQGVDAVTAPCRWVRGREDGDSFPSLRLNAQAPDFGLGKWCLLILICLSPLLVSPVWFCLLWSRLGHVQLDYLVSAGPCDLTHGMV